MRYPPKAVGIAPANDNALRVSHRGRSTYLYRDLSTAIARPEDVCNPANTAGSTSHVPNHWLGLR